MNWPKLSKIVLISLCAAYATAAHSDPLQVINQLRAGGCSASHLPALRSDSTLNAFTAQLARGASNEQAQDKTGYLYQELTTLRISGASDDTQLRTVLKQHYCSTLMKADWQQMSSVLRRQAWWIVLAKPHDLPVDRTAVAQQVLALVNQARARPRQCGKQHFAAAPALALNTHLTVAAQMQANDMAKHRFMDHIGTDGSTPAQRISLQHYLWKDAGENVAAGPGTADEVVSGWLNSPGHCANIMSSTFTEMGVAFAINKQDDYAVYWSQTLARPR